MAGNKASSQLNAIYQTVGNSEDEHIYANAPNVPWATPPTTKTKFSRIRANGIYLF